MRQLLVAMVVVAGLMGAPHATRARQQVGICHLPGHDGDFVLGNQQVNAPHRWCARFDGTPIWVSAQGCRHAHDAAAAPGGTWAGATCESFE